MGQSVIRGHFRRDRCCQRATLRVPGVVPTLGRAPRLAPTDPFSGDLRNAYLLEPGGRYLFGTDTQGRDA